MRSKLATVVRREFTSRLRQELPEFAEVKTKDIPSAYRLYAWQVVPDLTCYLMLVLYRTRDWFTIEAAWSESGNFPSDALLSLPSDPPHDGALRFRLPDLWLDSSHDFWWKLGPELSPLQEFEQSMNGTEEPIEVALERVPAAIDDAVHHIVRYGIPYFRTVIRSHG